MEIDIMGIVLAGIFAPSILFFAFGMASVFVKSDISIPPAMSTGLAIFLLASIGLEGGMEAVEALIDYPELLGVIAIVAIFAILCGAVFAYLTAHTLKKVAGLNTADAWAAGGHYGAVSSATLAVGVSVADAAQMAAPNDLIFGGW
ncbi:MAG: sodium-dependent bicarbonate transport family permease, partial [Methanosarcinales archaeon]|nr:sodium-dependent bicarbonate transport family permease [Methanosarcinales archaeon]